MRFGTGSTSTAWRPPPPQASSCSDSSLASRSSGFPTTARTGAACRTEGQSGAATTTDHHVDDPTVGRSGPRPERPTRLDRRARPAGRTRRPRRAPRTSSPKPAPANAGVTTAAAPPPASSSPGRRLTTTASGDHAARRPRHRRPRHRRPRHRRPRHRRPRRLRLCRLRPCRLRPCRLRPCRLRPCRRRRLLLGTDRSSRCRCCRSSRSRSGRGTGAHRRAVSPRSPDRRAAGTSEHHGCGNVARRTTRPGDEGTRRSATVASTGASSNRDPARSVQCVMTRGPARARALRGGVGMPTARSRGTAPGGSRSREGRARRDRDRRPARAA